MRTVRRLYFYLVAFISLEIVMWSVITLARTLFDASSLNAIGDQIAGGLAFLIVGLPIFLFHWFFIQKDIQHEMEERASLLREIFLYGVYLATLIPIAQNVIALVNRGTTALFKLDNTFSFLGSDQTVADNLVAIAVMVIVFLYFHNILRGEYAANTPGNDLHGTRRLFRYIWMLYSLVLVIFSVVYLLQYIFSIPTGLANLSRELLSNGLAITLVATPLWAYNWQVIQRSLSDRDEILSTLRLIVLYLLALAGVIITLSCAGWVLFVILRTILEQHPILNVEILERIKTALSFAIPMGVIWAYFGREWNKTIDEETNPLQRDALRRFYFYILSFLGNLAVFIGVQGIARVMIDILVEDFTGFSYYAGTISSSLSMLAVGLPVWLSNWPGLQAKASQIDDAGDHARRSVIRKSYLYLIIFSLVVGLMSSAGMLLYNLISTVTVKNSGSPLTNLAYDSTTLAIVIIWLVYHFSALRNDGKASQAAIAELHASFPVLLITDRLPELGDFVLEKLKAIAPRIPLTIQPATGINSADEFNNYKAIILPSDLITKPGSVFLNALETYTGKWIFLPSGRENWVWQGLVQKNRLDSAKETARIIRQLAENQPAQTLSTSSPLMIVGYVLGGLFALQILFMMIMGVISVFTGF